MRMLLGGNAIRRVVDDVWGKISAFKNVSEETMATSGENMDVLLRVENVQNSNCRTKDAIFGFEL